MWHTLQDFLFLGFGMLVDVINYLIQLSWGQSYLTDSFLNNKHETDFYGFHIWLGTPLVELRNNSVNVNAIR